MYTSIEFSKKLKEAGFEKKSEFVYVDTRKSWKEYNCKHENYEFKFIPFYNLSENNYECEFVKNNKYDIDNAKMRYNESEPLETYDILNDLCVEYAKEMFGEESINISFQNSEYKRKACDEIPEVILRMLKSNQAQKYIEDYIWSWCILNKDKK